jgi:hypothetical protein
MPSTLAPTGSITRSPNRRKDWAIMPDIVIGFILVFAGLALIAIGGR